ncbi:MAG: hypothetical protein CVV49_04460 [Spirochaetae bacterium HGW-Spirochaetae-5]|nr:MAG: hypothetical protein CVV49_04460 [Spirochaetae bacterium HGW-Spirochaetae-5]
MKRTKIASAIITVLLFTSFLYPQEIREEESLNYTYIGPSVSYAYNKAEYTDWFETSTETRSMSGSTLSGGASINIFTDNLCGEFQFKYAYSKFDFILTNLDFSISGKYYYALNSTVSIGAGPGLYFESPPSNRKHNGSAGLQIPVSLLLNTTADSKLFFDLFSRYGSFGIGENTKSISAGVNVGFIYKVGRI